MLLSLDSMSVSSKRSPPDRTSLRQERKRRTHARLLTVAYDLFARNGIVSTRTIDVARAAGVSHGTVFVHFPTREDLVAEIIGTRAKQILRRLRGLVEGSAGMRDVLAAHIEGLTEHEDFYALLVTEGPVLPDYVRTTLLGIQSVVSHHLAAAAERELSEGRIRRMPVHLLFNTWIGLVHHYVANRDLFAPGESVLKTRGPEILDHFAGLLAP
jgi:AcrR family transcriptional regulator